MEARSRATRVKLLAFDIDGVLTDGCMYYSGKGETFKVFNVHDGFGIKLAKLSGIEVAIISSRKSEMVAARAADLGITHVYQGVPNKRTLLAGLLEKVGFGWPGVAFMGDDLVDLPAMVRSGMALAPANAVSQVRAHAHYVTQAKAGDGAVREAIDYILAAQGKLDAIVAGYVDQA
ncbi:MAG: 3-deoxy-D-manno-octulosonate 8-phosphate phosphatase KdsC [Betaproteobacteria bacterium ADurb.Bin341]|nr:MAG: 3-deoxy-D-manno-octulosonate 8-phosphate phosphatase KdsC [Betaproteobacteria bacterium ADurb.Bin341]